MSHIFTIGVAGLNIEMHSEYEFSKNFCKDFIVANVDNPDITVVSDLEKIKSELALQNSRVSPEYAESFYLYRCIAEKIPDFNCFVFHGAAVEVDGVGYLFTAPSGTGKTTHIKLWQKILGDKMRIINGDKPIIKIENDGVYVCSVPWAGKENWKNNVIVPLKSIVLLQRSEENNIVKISPRKIVLDLLTQIYIPNNTENADKALDLLNKMCNNIEFYSLKCNMLEDAAKISYKALSGNDI